MRKDMVLILCCFLLWIVPGVMVQGLPGESAESILVQPDDLVYLGAFRLPGDDQRPNTFAWGGEAMTYRPGEGKDGFPGSLLVMGHNRMPYGELPDGNRVAEITIPPPVIAGRVENLNTAKFIQPFSPVADGFFLTLDEIPRAGMEYLNTPATGPRIHLAWGQHIQDDPTEIVASHAWFDPDLSQPSLQGPWFIGHQSPYSVNDYLFEIPAEWADRYLDGRYLATGRFKDGGWSGMGPALFAYRPWIDEAGTPADPQTRLSETTLLLYQNSIHSADIIRCLDGYQHGDEWTGGAWLTTETGKAAVIFAGTKSTGDRYWYGFIHPAGHQFACVEEEYLGQFTLCRLTDGTPCPDEYGLGCTGHDSQRGWWSTHFTARFMLYDPADFARVVLGEMEPWEPQPYAFLDIDRHLFLNPEGIEPGMLGSGPQRRYRLGDIAYDRSNNLIYVLELFADHAKPVVHVWRVNP